MTQCLKCRATWEFGLFKNCPNCGRYKIKKIRNKIKPNLTLKWKKEKYSNSWIAKIGSFTLEVPCCWTETKYFYWSLKEAGNLFDLNDYESIEKAKMQAEKWAVKEVTKMFKDLKL